MLSRRSLLGTAVGLLAAGPLASAVPAAAAASDGRDAGSSGQVHRRRSLRSGTRVDRPAVTLSHLAVAASGPVAVRLRTSAGWQPWRTLTGCPAGRDGDLAATVPSLLIPATGALGYEVRTTGGALADVTELNTASTAAQLAAAATVQRTSPLTAVPTGGIQNLPGYQSRQAWGANESYRLNPDGTLDTPPAFFPIQTLTVHHSGEEGGAPADPAAFVRSIYYNQAVNKDWGDIGYQLLIDAQGRIYEGTYSNADAVPVFGPTNGPDGRPLMVTGAHVGGFNSGNIGICMLGNFMTAPPTTAALHALTTVLGVLATAGRLDPLATARYQNPSGGAVAVLPTIAGHQDWHKANPAAGSTDCPGDRLYPLLPQLRRDVAALMS